VKILLSNDDGYRAAGLRALQRVLAPDHELVVSAPAGECSATGHGLTLHDPLRVRRVEEDGVLYHGVTGLPADAVKFGLTVLCHEAPPDLVVSGINHGANTGQNLFYSGTVAAAAEGTFAGIPAMAVSLATGHGPVREEALATAARVVRRLVGLMERHPLPAEVLLNVNVPDLPLGRMRGFRVSRMGHARFHEAFAERVDPGGESYWWMDGAKNGDDTDPEHDDCQVHDGWITLSPLRLDLSHPDWRGLLAPWRLDTLRAEEP
jgi:5'-nucleotidase